MSEYPVAVNAVKSVTYLSLLLRTLASPTPIYYYGAKRDICKRFKD